MCDHINEKDYGHKPVLLHECLDALAIRPDGVYVESLKQQDQTVQIQGIAQSNERVSELLNSLATKTPWLSKPELVEVVGTTTQINAKEKKRVSSFNLRFRLVRSSEMEQPAAGEKKK